MLANAPAPPDQLGQRYFVAKTERGICVVNYQPERDKYRNGPFLTWGGALTCVEVQRNHRRMNQALSALAIIASLSVIPAFF